LGAITDFLGGLLTLILAQDRFQEGQRFLFDELVGGREAGAEILHRLRRLKEARGEFDIQTFRIPEVGLDAQLHLARIFGERGKLDTQTHSQHRSSELFQRIVANIE
jgi:hypothetical protein